MLYSIFKKIFHKNENYTKWLDIIWLMINNIDKLFNNNLIVKKYYKNDNKYNIY